MSARKPVLPAAQVRLLMNAERCAENKEVDGVSVKGSTRKSALALEAAGLLRFEGYGPNVDSENGDDQEWPIYAITDAGLARLDALRGTR